MKVRSVFKFLSKGLLAALAVGGLLVYFIYYNDMRAAEARVNAERQIVETACGSVEYGEQGNGFPALVIHGAPSVSIIVRHARPII